MICDLVRENVAMETTQTLENLVDAACKVKEFWAWMKVILVVVMGYQVVVMGCEVEENGQENAND